MLWAFHDEILSTLSGDPPSAHLSVWTIAGLILVNTCLGIAIGRRRAGLPSSEPHSREWWFGALTENMPSAVYLKDLDGRIFFVNRHYLEMNGTGKADVLGKTAHDIFPRAAADAMVASDRRLIETGEMAELEQLEIVGNDKVRWVRRTKFLITDDNGAVIALGGISSDITELKLSTEARVESERRYRELIEQFPSAVYVLVGDRIELANSAAVDLFRAGSADDLIGTSFTCLIHPDARADRADRLSSRGDAADDFSILECPHLRLDGTVFDGKSMAKTISWDGRPATLVEVSDITSRKRDEDELKAARDSAEAANLAKAEFLANMSHEIRTPMNAVLGMAGILMGSELTDAQRDHVETIRNSGELLLTVLNDILDLSKMEAGKLELEVAPFEIAGVVRSIIGLLGTEARAKDLTVSFGIEPGMPARMAGDAGRIRQILLNLIGNAIKFTERGTIAIRVSADRTEGDTITTRFEVADTGPGLSEAEMSGLFSRFTQADSSLLRKYGGAGLGLAISKQLCELMGGEIGVDSEFGDGCNFWFTVTLGNVAGDDAEAASERPFAIVECSPEFKARRLRILVAEDNHVNQKVVMAMLAASGHAVDMAANGLEAVEAVQARPYDIVLMDIHMPEMDGIAATRRIRDLGGKLATIPIVAVTANAMKGDRERYLAAGMNDYVSKPIESAKLFEAISRHCGIAFAPNDAGAAKAKPPTMPRKRSPISSTAWTTSSPSRAE